MILLKQDELTTAQKKLLEVMVNPEHYGKSISAMCEIANVSRDIYYTAVKVPAFQDQIKDLSFRLVAERLCDVVMATTKYAIEESSCHSDRRMLLEMAGLIGNKIEVTAKVNTLQEMTEEELVARAKELEARISELIEKE